MNWFGLFLVGSVVGENEKPRRYLLYDTNPGEGFNLRRDVYMRVANLVNDLRFEIIYYRTSIRHVIVFDRWSNISRFQQNWDLNLFNLAVTAKTRYWRFWPMKRVKITGNRRVKAYFPVTKISGKRANSIGFWCCHPGVESATTGEKGIWNNLKSSGRNSLIFRSWIIMSQSWNWRIILKKLANRKSKKSGTSSGMPRDGEADGKKGMWSISNRAKCSNMDYMIYSPSGLIVQF